jgi:hypothetical protein
LVNAIKGEQFANEKAVLSLIVSSCYDLWWIEYLEKPESRNTLIDIYQDKYPELKEISKVRIDTAARVVMKFRKAMGVTV